MPTVLRKQARSIFQAALDSVRPEALVERAFDGESQLAEAVERARRIIVVGGGKAGASMVRGLKAALGGNRSRTTGIVNVPDNAVFPTQYVFLHPSRPMGVNVPTPASVEGTSKMLALVEQASEQDLVIALISGGGSALISKPSSGILLSEKIAATRLLSDRGATISELNCVRKHISQVKGGQLASRCRGPMWSLIISDVIGDPLDAIASGPTVADPTTLADALGMIRRYQLEEQLPTSVIGHLRNGQATETPKALPDTIHNLILANNATALAAARVAAASLGYQPHVVENVVGAVASVTTKIVDHIQTLRRSNMPTCLLVGGETTLALPANHGPGGRNQHLALSIAEKLGAGGLEHVTVLCAGTDGEDGPTDAAGAFVDQGMLADASAQGINVKDYLDRFASYEFFDLLGGLHKTGLTGTNVADLAVILINPESSKLSQSD